MRTYTQETPRYYRWTRQFDNIITLTCDDCRIAASAYADRNLTFNLSFFPISFVTFDNAELCGTCYDKYVTEHRQEWEVLLGRIGRGTRWENITGY